MELSMKSLLALALPLIVQARFIIDDSANGDGGGDPGSTAGNLDNWVGSANTAPILPSRDSFYRRQFANISQYRVGDIVQQRPVSVAGTYAGVSNAVQVLYRSNDAHDQATVSLATVLQPASSSNSDNTGKIIVFQIPEDSVYIDCAPSYQLFGRNTEAEVQRLLSSGYTVVVPDYEGQRSSFTVGKLAGKQILDAARAALKVPGVKPLNQSTSIGLWGYGTAAYATGAAVEALAEYAPELPVKGVALGAYITNLLSWLNGVNSSPNSAYIISSLLGMSKEYKDIDDALTVDVIPRRRSQFEAASTRCIGQNLLHYFEANVTSEFLTPGVDIFSEPKVESVYTLNSLGKSAPQVSLYVYQGTADTFASTGDVRTAVKEYCNAGTPVHYRELTGLTHNQARAQSIDDVLEYFSDALSGTPPTNSCEHIRNGNY